MFEKEKKNGNLLVHNKFVALPGQFKRQGDFQRGSFKFMLSPQCKLCSLAICRNLKDLQVIRVQSLERKIEGQRTQNICLRNLTFNEIITQTVHLLSANTTPEYYTCIYVSVNYMLSTNRHLIADCACFILYKQAMKNIYVIFVWTAHLSKNAKQLCKFIFIRILLTSCTSLLSSGKKSISVI